MPMRALLARCADAVRIVRMWCGQTGPKAQLFQRLTTHMKPAAGAAAAAGGSSSKSSLSSKSNVNEALLLHQQGTR